MCALRIPLCKIRQRLTQPDRMQKLRASKPSYDFPSRTHLFLALCIKHGNVFASLGASFYDGGRL